MSTRELERVEVMGRVAKEELKLMDAAAMLQLSYRQVKRLWRRYRQKGSQGLQHVIHHVHQATPRTSPFQPVVKTPVKLHQFAKVRLAFQKRRFSDSYPHLHIPHRPHLHPSCFARPMTKPRPYPTRLHLPTILVTAWT